MNDESTMWNELRADVAAAQTREQAELAAVEAMLTGAVDADEPMSPEQVDRIVEAATRPPGHMLTFPAWSRALAAVAAFALAPQTLLAASVATTIAVVCYTITYSTQTVGYQDAVGLMMNTESSEEARVAGQLTVFGDVHESIDLVQHVATGADPLAAQAQAVLAGLRVLAANGGQFALRALPGSHAALGDTVLDASATPVDRETALAQLALHLEYGILALATAAQQPGPDQLRVGAGIALDKVREQLMR